jgi:hypothetical protein
MQWFASQLPLSLHFLVVQMQTTHHYLLDTGYRHRLLHTDRRSALVR